MQWQYSELWDYPLVSGISIIFVGLFFLPLVLVSVATAVVVRTNFRIWERRLRIAWSAVSVLAAFFYHHGTCLQLQNGQSPGCYSRLGAFGLHSHCAAASNQGLLFEPTEQWWHVLEHWRCGPTAGSRAKTHFASLRLVLDVRRHQLPS